MKHQHLQEDERLQIKILKEKGYSNREIAKALGRDHTSIGRELSRNKAKGKYAPKAAISKLKVGK